MLFGGGKREGYLGSLPEGAVNPDAPAVCLHDVLYDGQPETRPTALARDDLLYLVEAVEYLLQLVCRDAAAGIGHLADHFAVPARDGNVDGSVRVSELDCVPEQVRKYLRDARFVTDGDDAIIGRRNVRGNGNRFLGGLRLEVGSDAARHRVHGDRLLSHFDSARLDA